MDHLWFLALGPLDECLEPALESFLQWCWFFEYGISGICPQGGNWKHLMDGF